MNGIAQIPFMFGNAWLQHQSFERSYEATDDYSRDQPQNPKVVDCSRCDPIARTAPDQSAVKSPISAGLNQPLRTVTIAHSIDQRKDLSYGLRMQMGECPSCNSTKQ